MAKYLIVKCKPLSDQWECDADREPICLTDDYDKYNKYGYEIYRINNDNSLTQVREYDSITTTKMGVYYWDDSFEVETTDPIVLETWKGDSNSITKSQVKKLKEKYHFKGTIKEIYTEITHCMGYGEENNGKWIVIGEINDNDYAIGY